MKKQILLGLSLGLLVVSQGANAFKIGPNIGLYTEQFDDGMCFTQREFGLHLGLRIEPSYKKECKGGNCNGNNGMMGMMMPMPMPMPFPVPVPMQESREETVRVAVVQSNQPIPKKEVLLVIEPDPVEQVRIMAAQPVFQQQTPMLMMPAMPAPALVEQPQFLPQMEQRQPEPQYVPTPPPIRGLW